MRSVLRTTATVIALGAISFLAYAHYHHRNPVTRRGSKPVRSVGLGGPMQFRASSSSRRRLAGRLVRATMWLSWSTGACSFRTCMSSPDPRTARPSRCELRKHKLQRSFGYRERRMTSSLFSGAPRTDARVGSFAWASVPE